MNPLLKSKLRLVTIPLHLSTAIYAILGIGILIFWIYAAFSSDSLYINTEEKMFMNIYGFVMVTLCAVMVVAIELAAWALNKGKFWGWVLSIALAGLYAPSGFILFGVAMFFGLLADPVKVHCSVGAKNKTLI